MEFMGKIWKKKKKMFEFLRWLSQAFTVMHFGDVTEFTQTTWADVACRSSLNFFKSP